jgi:hypothetical protein
MSSDAFRRFASVEAAFLNPRGFLAKDFNIAFFEGHGFTTVRALIR